MHMTFHDHIYPSIPFPYPHPHPLSSFHIPNSLPSIFIPFPSQISYMKYNMFYISV